MNDAMIVLKAIAGYFLLVKKQNGTLQVLDDSSPKRSQ